LLTFQGEFGVVYRGYIAGWKNKSSELVAIKTLKSKENRKSFVQKDFITFLWLF